MAKFGLVEFAQETRHEIAKVSWPTRHEVVTTTIVVMVGAVAFGLFFLAVDSVLGFAVRHILGMAS